MRGGGDEGRMRGEKIRGEGKRGGGEERRECE